MSPWPSHIDSNLRSQWEKTTICRSKPHLCIQTKTIHLVVCMPWLSHLGWQPVMLSVWHLLRLWSLRHAAVSDWIGILMLKTHCRVVYTGRVRSGSMGCTGSKSSRMWLAVLVAWSCILLVTRVWSAEIGFLKWCCNLCAISGPTILKHCSLNWRECTCNQELPVLGIRQTCRRRVYTNLW